MQKQFTLQVTKQVIEKTTSLVLTDTKRVLIAGEIPPQLQLIAFTDQKILDGLEYGKTYTITITEE